MNLLTLVEQLAGAEFEKQGKVNGGEWAGPCPFCQTGNDRFRVWPYKKPYPGWWCRVCGKSGGSIKLIMLLNNVSAREANDKLSEMNYPLDSESTAYEFREMKQQKPKPLSPTKSDFGNIETNIATVEQWHNQNKPKTLAYYGQWGITIEDIDRHWLGYSEEHHGFTIPHWWYEGGQTYLKGLKFRHITDDKRKRFSSVRGSLTIGPFNMQFVSNPDGTREGPVLDYLVIVEAEKDAILLEGMGYPTIGYIPEEANDYYLPYMLHNIVQPIFIYDADEGKGLDKALRVASNLRTRPILISTEKFNQKSPSDVVKAYDKEVLDWWMREDVGIEPIWTP